MADQTNTETKLFLRTKLHRQHLLDRLNQRLYRPLTLVSAPAGYGKSTLISVWLDTNDIPGAWLSLDEHDNDLRQFLIGFLMSVQTLFPDMGRRLHDLLDGSKLAPVQVLAYNLINELESIGKDFILVLDDFHCIHEKSVFALLEEVLKHPPQFLHLVLVSRKDPPLPLSSLRARNRLTEVRTHDLRFTDSDVHAFLKLTLAHQIEKTTAMVVAKKTEGWVTGLRLAVLAIRGRDDVEHKLRELSGTSQYVMDYLISDVLANQPPEVRHFLFCTSILDQFCSSLCDVLCNPDDETNPCEMRGDQCIAGLQKDNVFLIALDIENHWFRYHHLFQELLQRQLKQRFSAEEITALHRQASVWFESQNLVDEALHHALAAEDIERAAEIAERHSHLVMSAGNWHVSKKWLSRLPDSVVQGRPKLLMARVAQQWFQLDLAPVLPSLDRIDVLMGGDPKTHTLSGEVALFRGYTMLFQGEGARSLEYIGHALDRLPAENNGFRAEAEIVFGMAGQMVGQEERVKRALTQWLDQAGSIQPLRETYLTWTLLVVHYISGDLGGAHRYLQTLRDVASHHEAVVQQQMVVWCDHFEGLFHLQRGEIDAAIRLLVVAQERKYIQHAVAAADSMVALTLAYQVRGQAEQAGATMDSLREFATFTGPYSGVLADSCGARLALMQGRPEAAVRWLRATAPPPDGGMIIWCEIPGITRCRVMIAEGSAASLKEAEERLQEYAEQNEAQHNTLQLIAIFALQAVAFDKQGKPEEALTVLERALGLAQPGGFIFPFLELGPQMADLLKRLHNQNVAADYVGKILAAFPDFELGSGGLSSESETLTPSQSPKSKIQNSLIESLTNRELDVLELLAQRLQNKEIAEKLFISGETVKAHLKNIYQKLNVGKRREAVSKVMELGILKRRWIKNIV